MTPGRHVPLTLRLALLLLVVVAIATICSLASPTRERPADLTPTPYVPTVIVVDPTPRVSLPVATRTATMVPERLLTTPAVTRVPPTATPEPTSTPTAEPTRKPPEEMRQRGFHATLPSPA